MPTGAGASKVGTNRGCNDHRGENQTLHTKDQHQDQKDLHLRINLSQDNHPNTHKSIFVYEPHKSIFVYEPHKSIFVYGELCEHML